jgi:hypothetical protein
MTPSSASPYGTGTSTSKGLHFYAHNHFFLVDILYEYRGPVKRWDAGHFVECDRRGHEPGCEPPSADLLRCTP